MVWTQDCRCCTSSSRYLSHPDRTDAWYVESLCICGHRALIQCLRRLGPAHCYATSMSLPAVEQVISAMHVLRSKDGSNRGPEKIRQLHDNANYFRQKLQAMGCSVLGSSDSPVMVSMFVCIPLVVDLGKYACTVHVLQVTSVFRCS